MVRLGTILRCPVLTAISGRRVCFRTEPETAAQVLTNAGNKRVYAPHTKSLMFGQNFNYARYGAALMLIALGACADKKKDVDTDLSRDLVLAQQVPATPQFRDTAVAPTPAPAEVTPPSNVVGRATRQRVVERPAPAPEKTTIAPQPTPVAETPAPAPVPEPATVVAAIGAGTRI